MLEIEEVQELNSEEHHTINVMRSCSEHIHVFLL